MKIAYIISAYKLPDQLARLVRRLNTDETAFFIHVDKKTDQEIYNSMVDPLSVYANIHFLKRSLCYWGDFGHVRASLTGIQEILASKVRYDYVILLTGQDYPIKSNHFIQEFLQKSEGRSYIECTTLDPQTEKWSYRIGYWHFFWRGGHFLFPRSDMFSNSPLKLFWNVLLRRIPNRKFPQGLEPFSGSSYWCLSRECVEYVYKFVRHNKAYVNFFKYAYVPDEVFFQTILQNSLLRNSLVTNSLNYIDFSERKSHPKILRKDDFLLFINTDNLFARKFDIEVDAEVLDLIDRSIS